MLKKFALIAAVAGLALAGCNNSAKPTTPQKNIVAATLSDGRTLFGDLQGSELCHYVFVATVVDPKTKKPGPQIIKGGVQYGGDGCLEIRENILTTEKLVDTSPFYGAVNQLESKSK